jgi:Na+-transporting methylmalonyl-CoA/oxaloacetate decarboxylase gamma subunit
LRISIVWAVFSILCLLILVISIVARLVPDETPVAAKPTAPKVDNDHVAAISAALHQYRKNRK